MVTWGAPVFDFVLHTLIYPYYDGILASFFWRYVHENPVIPSRWNFFSYVLGTRSYVPYLMYHQKVSSIRSLKQAKSSVLEAKMHDTFRAFESSQMEFSLAFFGWNIPRAKAPAKEDIIERDLSPESSCLGQMPREYWLYFQPSTNYAMSFSTLWYDVLVCNYFRFAT